MAQTDTLPAYRWVIAIAAGLILGVGMGATMNGITAYIVPMEITFGWSRSEISTINVIGLIGLAIGGVVMGSLGDRLGTRPVVLFGATVLGICYLLASQATELWQLYVLMGIAGALGAASIFAPMFAAVGNWFPVGAGFAIGIASERSALCFELTWAPMLGSARFVVGRARGVGLATTQSVVVSSVMILISDYFLTALMFE